MSRFMPSSENKLAGNGQSGLSSLGLPNREASHMIQRQGVGRMDEALILEAFPAETINDTSDERMLQIAQQNYNTSEEYFNASHRTRIMDAMSRFNSQHPKGSKYWQDAFLRRSKIFRPKTRSVIRKREAAAIMAMFSTSAVTAIDASDNGNPQAAKDARIQQHLLNHRLNEDARFYQFVMGCVQDADRQGIVCAATQWEYREATRYYDRIRTDEHGNQSRDRISARMPTFDRPSWRLVPIENIRFSPGCDWMDPVNSSPYLIELMPKYVCEIRQEMKNPRARLKYRDLNDAMLMMGTKSNEWDPIRIQREHNRQDRYARQGEIHDYSIVWVHRNIIRVEGEDYIYDTIGTQVMLSDLVPLNQVDPRGYRPYVIGGMTLESHNPFPEGTATLMSQLQDELNDNANLRTDMNKMATAGRYFVKRTAGIDLHALARFSPGSAVEMDDPANSVKWDRATPPPSSNFEENNLLNTEIDDLVGNFNQGSVAANKQLNETVGGLSMLGDVGTQMTEYDMRTLAKTVFEPVLRQTLDLVRMYETDRALAAQIGSKFAISEVQYWNSLQTQTTLNINVGFGATNPMKKLEKLQAGMKIMGEFFPYMMMMADQAEIVQEVFGAVGYPDAERFFPFLDEKTQQDPKYRALIMQLNQMRMLSFPHIAEAQGRQQQGQAQAMGAITAAKIKAQADVSKTREQIAGQLKLKEMELALARVELQIEYAKTDIAREELNLERQKLANDIAMQQEQMLITAQGTQVKNPHAEPGQPTPEQEQQIQSLDQPGSQGVQLPPLDSLMQQLSGKLGGPVGGGEDDDSDDGMTVGEMQQSGGPPA